MYHAQGKSKLLTGFGFVNPIERQQHYVLQNLTKGAGKYGMQIVYQCLYFAFINSTGSDECKRLMLYLPYEIRNLIKDYRDRINKVIYNYVCFVSSRRKNSSTKRRTITVSHY